MDCTCFWKIKVQISFIQIPMFKKNNWKKSFFCQFFIKINHFSPKHNNFVNLKWTGVHIPFTKIYSVSLKMWTSSHHSSWKKMWTCSLQTSLILWVNGKWTAFTSHQSMVWYEICSTVKSATFLKKIQINLDHKPIF